MAVVRVSSPPLVRRLQTGPVDTVRLRFQSGVPGPIGPEGPEGDIGPEGPQGDTGPQGPSVSDGDKGDVIVSGSGATWTVDANAITTAKIINDAVTDAKLADMTAGTLKGRTATDGDPQSLSGAEVRDSILPTGFAIGFSSAIYNNNSNLTTQIPLDDTIPTSSEGTEIISLSYTAKSTTNKLLLSFNGFCSPSAASHIVATLFSGTTCIGVTDTYANGANEAKGLALNVIYTPGTTSAVTYSARVGPTNAVTLRMNGSSSARWFGGTAVSALSITEIKA